MRYILAILLLMNASCAFPLAASAYELRMSEELPSAAAEPVAAAAPESSLWDISLPVELQWAFWIGAALLLAWWSGVPNLYHRMVKGLAIRKRAVRHADNMSRKRPNGAVRAEQRPKALPAGPVRAPVAEVSDLTRAKTLLLEENYAQAEQPAIAAIRSEPYSLDAYAVALKILSRYQTPQLKGVVRGGLQLLRLKNPRLWHDVAVLGRKLAPEIEDWDDEPVSKPHS